MPREATNSSTKTSEFAPRPCELARNDGAGVTETHSGRIGASGGDSVATLASLLVIPRTIARGLIEMPRSLGWGPGAKGAEGG